ncbi:chaperone modulator CbpM [Falsiroseomonas tokyonensis]|uniref:Chaperone modulator CbpM n=1 Tax=Falsiroseomonas tokyonensis TaxID=430521 RepID=A0ABV7BTF7_9PROT|nr:chaperone modulator CbpM [Falsiroseomonas tokyonensis]
MMTLEVLCARFEGLDPEDLRGWIGAGLLRADAEGETLVFQEIDVERVRLILELRETLALEEEALALVLSLLDQIYALRRRLGES